MKTITVIPLGVPGSIALSSVEALKKADRLYLQTAEHPASRIVVGESGLRPDAIALDELYRSSFDFEELNSRIAERLTGDGAENVGFAVIGRGVGADLAGKLAKKAAEKHISLRFLPSSGFAEAALAAAFSAGETEPFSDYDLRTARSLMVSSPELPLVIEECDTLLRAGEVKLQLLEYYPDDHRVMLCSMDDSGAYKAQSLPVFELDRPGNARLYGAATVLIVPACPLTKRTRHGMESLMEVMHRLRAPGGCPWDAEQTHSSLRSSLIEESYEVLDAIDREDMTALEEELGDLLLQVVFHAVIEEERSEFNMRDVITGIVNKLIYRHPHVFGDVKVNSSDDVLVNWENLKQKEKHQQTVADAMRSVPASFPALMRSYKIQKKAAHVGFDWPSAEEAFPKIAEEAEEVREAMAEGSGPHLAEEIGDLLFAVVNVARLKKVDPELALGAASDKFMRRFIAMEELIAKEGLSLSDMTLEEMDRRWDRVKKGE